MKKQLAIKKAAMAFVDRNSVWFTDFTNWYVGITANPNQRHSAHGRPRLWKVWELDHPTHARDMEKHFLSLGFKGAPGGGTRTKFVYIYKHSGPLA